MPAPKTILLTFANDRTAYLQQLKEESRTIFSMLHPLEEREAIRIVREENAETRDLIDQINRHQDDILIFHYAGHADDQSLRFEAGEGHAKGIASLLGQLPNLRLAFLNGCSTLGLVDQMLEEGVPAVIATRSPIDDDRATAFARVFYHNLANQGTIKRAFGIAKAKMLTDFRDFQVDDLKLVPVHRGIRLAREGEDEAMPWGLYYREDQDAILDWTLPAYSQRGDDGGSASFRPNEFLKHVPEAMAEQSPTFRQKLRETTSEREALKLMVEHFPWNIGSQVARLVGLQPPLSGPTPERLEQLLSTYLACKQFIYFITLSEMWQAVEERDLSSAREEMHQVFNLTRDNALSFQYLDRSARLQRHMDELGIRYFVPELKDLSADLDEASAGGQARAFLNGLLHRYLDAGPDAFGSDIVRICSEAEKNLTFWLYRLAFLADYWMVTVRDISIKRRPHEDKAVFKHKVGRLSAFTENLLGLYDEPRDFADFFFDNCVILFRDLTKATECLVLTPFYIDKNAYVADRPPQMQLFTFGFKGPEDRPGAQFHFVNSGQNLFKAFAEERFQLHTGMELGSGSGQPLTRALMPWEKKNHEKVLPYQTLKEQFDALF